MDAVDGLCVSIAIGAILTAITLAIIMTKTKDKP